MKLPLIYISEIEDEKERQEFWDQGISLDDWDYMLLFPSEILMEEEYEENDRWEDYSPKYDKKNNPVLVKKKRWILNYEVLGGDYYTLDNLLNGCYDNKWYKAKYQGQEYAIGVAYHG